ncbi:MAG: glycosyltransferase family 4 protein [Archaeoglobaceae archaeon]|nr:glycosyltransferase family 4 protein [Archaeoglobaceae archaeon]
MRILWFSNTISGRYGYSVVTSPVTEALQKAGHQMIVFGMQSIHPPFKDEIGRVHVGLRYDAFGSDILGNLLKAYKIDLLITVFDVWLDQAQYIPPTCQKLQIPFVSHITANSYPLSPFLARFCQFAKMLVAPSKFVEKCLYEVFPQKTIRIPHGVDLNIYKPLSEEEKQEFKERLRIEDKEFIMVSVMRNKGLQKNFPALFHAWKLMLETYEELRKDGILLILSDPLEGEGIRLDLLRNLAGLDSNNIMFIWGKPNKDLSTLEMTYENDPEGFMHNANYCFGPEEMCKLYNIADVHVISSAGESFNLPSLEAMACGTPIIMPDNTTGPELVGEGKTGLLAKCKFETTTPLISDIRYVCPKSLAECMEKLYLNKKLREKCANNARKFAKNYSWEKINKLWINLVNAVPYLG